MIGSFGPSQSVPVVAPSRVISGMASEIGKSQLSIPCVLHDEDALIGNSIVSSAFIPCVNEESAPDYVLSYDNERNSPERHERRMPSAFRSNAPITQGRGFPEKHKAAPHQAEGNRGPVIGMKNHLRVWHPRPVQALPGVQFRLNFRRRLRINHCNVRL